MERVATYVCHRPRGVTVQVITGPCDQVKALRDVYLEAHRRAIIAFEQWDTRIDHATVEIESRPVRLRTTR